MAQPDMASLHWLDVMILGIFLLISIGIGIYHALTGGRQRTTAEFIMANRKLQVIPTVISMMVSFQSAIMILGTVAEMYRYILCFVYALVIGNTKCLLAPLHSANCIFLFILMDVQTRERESSHGFCGI